MSEKTLTLHLTTDLGASVSVNVLESELQSTLERYGMRGWYSGELPPGGFVVPYENEADFNWALIGARIFPDKESGELMVWCRGHTWKRRDLPADTKKKMPPVIKYSRGAKAFDPQHLREGDDDGIQYITLISFRGGKKQQRYAKTKAQNAEDSNG
jgi:hypothetical protein